MAPNDKEKADLSSRVESWGGSRSSAALPPLNTHYSISEPGPVPTAASDCLTTTVCTYLYQAVCLYFCSRVWRLFFAFHLTLGFSTHSHSSHHNNPSVSLPLKSRCVQSFYWYILRPNDDRMWGDMKWRPSQGVRCAEIVRRGGGRRPVWVSICFCLIRVWRPRPRPRQPRQRSPAQKFSKFWQNITFVLAHISHFRAAPHWRGHKRRIRPLIIPDTETEARDEAEYWQQQQFSSSLRV